MAYNYTKAEKEWKKWKRAEEKILRESGVSEDIIQQIRKADWDDFKKERIFYMHHLDEFDPELAKQMPKDISEEIPIHNVSRLLDDLDNQQLFRTIVEVDEIGQKILLYKILGYKTKDISDAIGISENAIKSRMRRLKKKIKNFFD